MSVRPFDFQHFI